MVEIVRIKKNPPIVIFNGIFWFSLPKPDIHILKSISFLKIVRSFLRYTHTTNKILKATSHKPHNKIGDKKTQDTSIAICIERKMEIKNIKTL